MGKADKFRKAEPLFSVCFDDRQNKWCVTRKKEGNWGPPEFLHADGAVRGSTLRNGKFSGWYNCEQDAVDSLNRWRQKRMAKGA